MVSYFSLGNGDWTVSKGAGDEGSARRALGSARVGGAPVFGAAGARKLPPEQFAIWCKIER